jgi:hypothetical protein
MNQNRIRSLVAISALTGATVIGGAGLAGAESHDADSDSSEVTLVEDVIEAPAAIDSADEEADDAETGTEDDEDGEGIADRGAEETEDAEAKEAADDDYRNHGSRVSATAQSTEPGPGHGAVVSAVARQNGEEQRAAGADETDETSDDGVTEADDDETGDDGVTEADDDETGDDPVTETDADETDADGTDETEADETEADETRAQAGPPEHAAAGQRG